MPLNGTWFNWVNTLKKEIIFFGVVYSNIISYEVLILTGNNSFNYLLLIFFMFLITYNSYMDINIV